jgi:hypothetical protein
MRLRLQSSGGSSVLSLADDATLLDLHVAVHKELGVTFPIFLNALMWPMSMCPQLSSQ